MSNTAQCREPGPVPFDVGVQYGAAVQIIRLRRPIAWLIVAMVLDHCLLRRATLACLALHNLCRSKRGKVRSKP